MKELTSNESVDAHVYSHVYCSSVTLSHFDSDLSFHRELWNYNGKPMENEKHFQKQYYFFLSTSF